MPDHSKLVLLKLRNIGCIGPEGLEISLDNIVCLVGRNNAGKSTVIRAYELAQGSLALTDQDRCIWTPEGDCPEVELWVHIPDGIPNIDTKWKQDRAGLKIVRSRWLWRDSGKPIRQTWDPEANDGKGDWAEDGKAGGADNVFNSRLPQPLRVDALQDAFSEHDELLKLVTEPAVVELKKLQKDKDSPLRKAIEQYVSAAMNPVEQYQEAVNRIGTQVHQSFQGVFPELDVHIRVAMEPPVVDAAKALLLGSSIRFQQGSSNTGIKQQGTGSRRALFWTLLQVRNGILRERKSETERSKAVSKLALEIEKENKKKRPDSEKIEGMIQKIHAMEEAGEDDADELALPGYILLIDEPENCLHPMAVRAARAHLYALAQDPNWQVMLSTHSPYFIDPLADHTTIVRLEREDRQTSPRTFRTSTIRFSKEEKENLRALLQMDNALAEMFFGSYPIVVEGDTELAAFVASILEEQDSLGKQATLIPARGKALIVPVIKLLTHFRIPFGVLHDSDSPKRRDGKRNGSWKENEKIAEAIVQARALEIAVRHRVSVPDFERRFGSPEGDKDKPLVTYRLIHENTNAKELAQALFRDLFNSDQHQPNSVLVGDATAAEIAASITAQAKLWANAEAPDDPRFKF